MRALPLALLLAALPAAAQGGWRPAPGVRLSGTLTVTAEGGRRADPFRAGPPAQQALGVGAVTVTLFDGLVLPFQVYASPSGGGYQHPFNQVGVSPRWRWARGHAGYFTTRHSELSLADARLLGAGLELTPGPLRLAVATGTSQRAVAADPAALRQGLHRRRLTAAQLGLGREGGWHLWASGLRAVDDTASLGAAGPVGPAPQENLVGAVRFGAPLWGERLALTGEVAASAHSADTRADTLADVSDLGGVAEALGPLFTARTSSRVDGAATVALTAQPTRALGLQVQARYVGPGFVSLGALQTEADVLDVLVAPRLTLPRLALAARAGVRRNNVADTRLTTTRRALFGLTATARPSDALAVAAQYANYGLRASQDADTLRLAQIAHLASVSPTLTLRRGAVTHVGTASYTFQASLDRNTVSGGLGDTRNHALVLSHTVALPGGLAVTSSGTATGGVAAGFRSRVWSLTETVARPVLGGRLRLGASAGVHRVETTATDTGLILGLRAGAPVAAGGTVDVVLDARLFSTTDPVREPTRDVVGRVSFTQSF